MAEEALELARAAAVAALATDGVRSLGKGRFSEAATYGAGEKVSGVVVTPEEVEVHVIAAYPLRRPIPQLAQNIRDNVGAHAGGRRTVVVIEDLEMGEA